MDAATQYVLTLLIGTYAVILSGATVFLWQKINQVDQSTTNLRIQVASSYHTKDELRQIIADAMSPFVEQLRQLRSGVDDMRHSLHGRGKNE
jgi:hypothetical protein